MMCLGTSSRRMKQRVRLRNTAAAEEYAGSLFIRKSHVPSPDVNLSPSLSLLMKESSTNVVNPSDRILDPGKRYSVFV